jgi:hypothetical protein
MSPTRRIYCFSETRPKSLSFEGRKDRGRRSGSLVRIRQRPPLTSVVLANLRIKISQPEAMYYNTRTELKARADAFKERDTNLDTIRNPAMPSDEPSTGKASIQD